MTILCPAQKEKQKVSFIYIKTNIEHLFFCPTGFHNLTLKLHHFESKFCETSYLYAGLITLGSVSIALCKANHDIITYILNGPEPLSSSDIVTEATSSSEKLLRASFQFPKEFGNENVPSVFSLRLLKISAIPGPQLASWLKYAPKPSRRKEPRREIFLKKISEVKSFPKLSRKSSECDLETLRQESSSTTLSEAMTASKIFTSGRQTNVSQEPRVKNWKEKFVEAYPLLSNLIVHVEIDLCTVFISNHSINISSEYGIVNAIHRTYLTRGEKSSLGDTTVICLPHILLQNAAQKQPLISQILSDFIILPKTIWSEGE